MTTPLISIWSDAANGRDECLPDPRERERRRRPLNPNAEAPCCRHCGRGLTFSGLCLCPGACKEPLRG